MKVFVIHDDNNITACASTRAARQIPNAEVFTSEETLATLAAGWPASRVVTIWNSLTGVMPVKKFKDRATAASRIWTTIQNLEPAAANVSEASGQKIACSEVREPSAAQAREGSKKAQVLALLRTEIGATIEDLMSATGWQKHSIRGFLSGALNRKGVTVESVKREDGERVYRVTGV